MITKKESWNKTKLTIELKDSTWEKLCSLLRLAEDEDLHNFQAELRDHFSEANYEVLFNDDSYTIREEIPF